MKIDFPTPNQGQQLVALWQEAFGDSLEFIEGFFCTGYSPARCRCLTVDNKVAAGLYWLEVQYKGQRFAYLYAVAVKKEFRGQGLCRRLMEDTHAHLLLRGYDGVLLYPATDDLRNLYTRLGYVPATTVSRFCCSAAGEAVTMHRIDRDEYARLRRTYLPEDGVIQEEENIDFQEMLAFFYAGEDFLLTARKKGQKLTGLELLGSTAAAPGILAALNCTEGTFQTPGTDIPYAMFLPLHGNAAKPGYFGFAFN